jgi:putative endonuclease
MYCVYILYSEKLDRFYTGYTANLSGRLEFHSNAAIRKYTYRANDWILFYKISCKSKTQALKIERHIKLMKSSVYINNLLKYPEMTVRLLTKYDV